MITNKNKYLFYFIFIFFYSCSDSDDVTKTFESKEYSILSITTEVPIDFNNDGIKSNYILDSSKPNEVYSYYNNTRASVLYNTGRGGEIIFPQVFQNIIYKDSLDLPPVKGYILQYIRFSFNTDNSENISVTSINSDNDLNNYISKISVKRIKSDSIIINLVSKMYDYEDSKWKNINLEVTFGEDSNNL